MKSDIARPDPKILKAGRYRFKSLKDRSLKDDAKDYSSPDKLREALYQAGITNFRIIYDRACFLGRIK